MSLKRQAGLSFPFLCLDFPPSYIYPFLCVDNYLVCLIRLFIPDTATQLAYELEVSESHLPSFFTDKAAPGHLSGG